MGESTYYISPAREVMFFVKCLPIKGLPREEILKQERPTVH
jgi:hypothetical protein